ncbi:hypothetical protein BABINDRAFT_163647 [Babjeviella inositovora NRRL Y-12698]|uniref:PQ loop repeat protein n=1 Tax=Babjeviella inositovora NRRL Y-12698 TaxID=984486 RepID=A0A1E3QI78_9ASCO|nr:uncharacterized protein BABINDRAFT_163647 [Babjeviella inositovora NRRL Y-12698]ODQ77401.1 hypothetical protein BABINDRAFT_163647 [Babjeviella inositovora NRRL Y-12698]
MANNNVAANVLATIGATLWCIQLIPQIIRNYRVKDCTGLPPLMMFLWMISGIPFGIYFSVTDATIPVKIQPHLFTFFASLTFIQTLYYPPVQIPKTRVIAVIVLTYATAIGLEVGVILNMIPRYKANGHDNDWGPVLAVGVTASILLAAGLIPPYLELSKNKGRVVGLNFMFLAMDCAGAIFSTASVALSSSEPGKELDVMGITLYIIVAGMELGIFASHGIWYLRYRTFNKGGEDVGLQLQSDAEEISDSACVSVHTSDKGSCCYKF